MAISERTWRTAKRGQKLRDFILKTGFELILKSVMTDLRYVDKKVVVNRVKMEKLNIGCRSCSKGFSWLV